MARLTIIQYASLVYIISSVILIHKLNIIIKDYVICLQIFSAAILSDIITRNSSGDEIANVNFLYDDIVHAQQNTIDSCINSATD